MTNTFAATIMPQNSVCSNNSQTVVAWFRNLLNMKYVCSTYSTLYVLTGYQVMIVNSETIFYERNRNKIAVFCLRNWVIVKIYLTFCFGNILLAHLPFVGNKTILTLGSKFKVLDAIILMRIELEGHNSFYLIWPSKQKICCGLIITNL